MSSDVYRLRKVNDVGMRYVALCAIEADARLSDKRGPLCYSHTAFVYDGPYWSIIPALLDSMKDTMMPISACQYWRMPD